MGHAGPSGQGIGGRRCDYKGGRQPIYKTKSKGCRNYKVIDVHVMFPEFL